MAEYQPLKSYVNAAMARQLAEQIKAVYADFAVEPFVEQASSGLEELELKERVAHMAVCLRDYLPAEYPEAVNLLLAILGPDNRTEEEPWGEWYFLMPVAYFVEAYGLEHFDESMVAMYEITKRHTSEFAVRPFLMRYPQRTLERRHQWVKDENLHVRRWVSEGTRPNAGLKPRVIWVRYLILIPKLSQKSLKGGQSMDLQKKHAIKAITTRRYYAGTHRLEIQVNGKILGGVEFELRM